MHLLTTIVSALEVEKAVIDQNALRASGRSVSPSWQNSFGGRPFLLASVTADFIPLFLLLLLVSIMGAQTEVSLRKSSFGPRSVQLYIKRFLYPLHPPMCLHMHIPMQVDAKSKGKHWVDGKGALLS